MKHLVILFYFQYLCFSLTAQPSEAEIKKQLTSTNTMSIKFTKTTGTRQWNGSVGNWEYVRGVVITQSSLAFPEYTVIIGGDAVYQDMGGGKYSYRKFRSLYQNYIGIPNPTKEEIETILNKDWSKFYGSKFKQIVALHTEPRIADTANWTWTSPNAVRFDMEYKADIINSNIEVITSVEKVNVELYRDNPKQDWKGILVTPVKSNTIESKKYSYEYIDQMRQKSFAFKLQEKKSATYLAALPKLTVPEFSSALELATYVHNVLINGNTQQLEAVLWPLLLPKLYKEPGSNVQLNGRGAELINKTAAVAYDGVLTYKQSYCSTITKNKQTNANHIYIYGAILNNKTLISCIEEKAGYAEGKPIMKWYITNIDVGVKQDTDAQAYYNSFKDKSTLCNGN